MPPAAIAGAGLGASALGGAYSTYEQAQAAKKNFAAQQAFQQYMQQQVQGQMQNGQNPISQQILGLFGGSPQFQNPGQAQSFGYTPATAATPDMLSFQNVNAPNPIKVQQVGAPSFGEAYNTGQDSLMQMLRKQFMPAQDQGLQSTLQGLYSGTGYDANKVIDALAPIDQRLIDEQTSQLRGSTAGLGERFGSALGQNERDLRERFLQDVTGRNAQLMQSAYNQNQQTQLQALGLGQQQQQFLSQFPLQAAGLQQQAASQLLGAGFQGAQLGQQGQLANAANSLQAQGIDVNAIMQSALANQQAGIQTGQTNQNLLAQLGLSNANILNQAGQFNAQQQSGAQGLNFNQANLFNQMLLGGLGQANQMQQGQQGLNAQLLGILGGISVPQQQPGQYGQAVQGLGESAMLFPFLQQFLGGGGGGGQPWTPVGYNPNPTFNFPTSLFAGVR